MKWEVRVPERVTKRIRKFPRKDRAHIFAALYELEVNPWRGDIVKIQGEENLWRKRTGSYRIFYSVNQKDRVVEIKEVALRTSKTY